MNRKTIINIHLYLAALFAPIILLMSVSGGLYLFGYKGGYEKELVTRVDAVSINAKSKTLKQDVQNLLAQNGVEIEFEYVKVKKNDFYTRPTNRMHYLLRNKSDSVEIIRVQPDFIASIVELHKGHGPIAFKWLEKILAFVLVIVMLTGVWLGIKSPALRMPTLASLGAGGLVVLLLALI